MEPTFTADISALLNRELEGFQREIQLFPDDASVWATRPGIANAARNAAVHLAESHRHLIRSELRDSPYRHRPEQESGRRHGTHDELVAELTTAAIVVGEVLPRLDTTRLDAPFHVAGLPRPVST